MDKIPDLNFFSACLLETATTKARQITGFLYYRSKYLGSPATLAELREDFEFAKLGSLDGTLVRTTLKNDRRVRKVKKDKWLIPADRFVLIEAELDLSRCVVEAPSVKKNKTVAKRKRKNNYSFVDKVRIQELNEIKNDNYDVTRLIQMCHEINDNVSNDNWISTILLVRAVLDHVPPIFGFSTFTEVSNNFSTTKSIKVSLQHLQKSSRTIADSHLHTPIRKKETLPTKTQVNFSNDLDVLLAEIICLL